MKNIFLGFAASILVACASAPTYEKPENFTVAKIPYTATKSTARDLPQALSATEFQAFYKELGEVASRGSEGILQMHAQNLSEYAKKMERRAAFWQRYVLALKPTELWDLGAARQKLGEEGFNKKFKNEMEILQANLELNKNFADYTLDERNYLASEFQFGIEAIFLKMATLAQQSLQQRIY